MQDHDDGRGGPERQRDGRPTGLSPAQIAVRESGARGRSADPASRDRPDPFRQRRPDSRRPGDRSGDRSGDASQPNGLATASLVCGLIALLINPFLILGIVAIILGVNAKKRPGGHGMANAGIVLGLVATVLAVVLMTVFVPQLR